jgi:hypothetical protein
VKYTYYAAGDTNGHGGTLASGDKRIGNLKEVHRLARSVPNQQGSDSDYDITTYYDRIVDAGSVCLPGLGDVHVDGVDNAHME